MTMKYVKKFLLGVLVIIVGPPLFIIAIPFFMIYQIGVGVSEMYNSGRK